MRSSVDTNYEVIVNISAEPALHPDLRDHLEVDWNARPASEGGRELKEWADANGYVLVP